MTTWDARRQAELVKCGVSPGKALSIVRGRMPELKKLVQIGGKASERAAARATKVQSVLGKANERLLAQGAPRGVLERRHYFRQLKEMQGLTGDAGRILKKQEPKSKKRLLKPLGYGALGAAALGGGALALHKPKPNPQNDKYYQP